MNVVKRYTDIGGGLQTPDKLIIHCIAEFIEVDEPFEYKGKLIEVGKYSAHEWLVMLGLSVHFLIEPNGDVIKQRSTKKICWHAKGFNTGSVGIEVLVEGVWNYETFKNRIKSYWVSQYQYDTLIELSDNIIEYFDIDHKDVLRHSDISPGRKVDPGYGFQWVWYKEQLT
jgi:N-acetyl-anhydromuramyl-L-alanine amidase AmpD